DAQADGQHADGGEQRTLEQRAERDAEIVAHGRGSSSGKSAGDGDARARVRESCVPRRSDLVTVCGGTICAPFAPAGAARAMTAAATARPAAGHSTPTAPPRAQGWGRPRRGIVQGRGPSADPRPGSAVADARLVDSAP